ncbi:uncharacterized protein K441DRAFT_662565 [Cenococcum geophilum 1.58]|uniref:uncharacterized protein n=1 Tax=Cenococcum geophilum 1.58 TaxID=794803 RepID=UPI00358F56EC|nr:hypothetical protein K441DRAFT_662565 [Cenococcum geophilum 1.58]
MARRLTTNQKSKNPLAHWGNVLIMVIVPGSTPGTLNGFCSFFFFPSFSHNTRQNAHHKV